MNINKFSNFIKKCSFLQNIFIKYNIEIKQINEIKIILYFITGL
jgi:hypothetical protein